MKLEEDLLAVGIEDVADPEIHRVVLQIHDCSSRALYSSAFKNSKVSAQGTCQDYRTSLLAHHIDYLKVMERIDFWITVAMRNAENCFRKNVSYTELVFHPREDRAN